MHFYENIVSKLRYWLNGAYLALLYTKQGALFMEVSISEKSVSRRFECVPSYGIYNMIHNNGGIHKFTNNTRQKSRKLGQLYPWCTPTYCILIPWYMSGV